MQTDKPIIIFASDHGGFEAKRILIEYFKTRNEYEVVDTGPFVFDDQDDYPVTISPMCKLLLELTEHKKQVFGVGIGRSGQGEAMVCNRFKGIRAIEISTPDLEMVKRGRQHNDANVVCFGTDFVDTVDAQDIIEVFVKESFSGEHRHMRRISLLDDTQIYE